MVTSTTLPELARLIASGKTTFDFTISLPARVDTRWVSNGGNSGVKDVAVPAASVTVTVSLLELVGLARRAQSNKGGRATLGGHKAKRKAVR